jgi:hypothetical protein
VPNHALPQTGHALDAFSLFRALPECAGGRASPTRATAGDDRVLDKVRVLVSAYAQACRADLSEAGCVPRVEMAVEAGERWQVLVVAFPTLPGTEVPGLTESARDCLALLSQAREPRAGLRSGSHGRSFYGRAWRHRGRRVRDGPEHASAPIVADTQPESIKTLFTAQLY